MFDSLFELVVAHRQSATTGTVLYSACFGDYDTVRRPKTDESYHCYFFTDRKLPTRFRGWTPVFVDIGDIDPAIANRAFKCLGHIAFPNSARNIYVDSSFLYIRNISKFMEDKFDGDIAAFQHSSRRNIWEEAEACIFQGKGSKEIILKQIKSYEKSGFHERNTLYELGVISRSTQSTLVGGTCELWLKELTKHSLRDQISFPFVAWKNGMKIDVVHENIFYNHYLVPVAHRQSSIRKKFQRIIAVYLFILGLNRRKK